MIPRLRRSLRRVRSAAWPVAQAALAAGIAWFLAFRVLGHAQPVFAPTAAVVALAANVGCRGRLGVEFSVIMRVQEFLDGGPIQFEFIKRLDERYRREGIEVPFPTMVGVLADGSKPGGNTEAGPAGAAQDRSP